jgi:amphi-Trp domain-containing protein
MGKEKEREEFEFASITDAKEAAAYLDSLAKGFKEGRIVLSAADQEIFLTPEGDLDVEIAAKKKEEKSKIELQISWKKATPSTGEPLAITSAGASVTLPPKKEAKA